MFVPGPGQPGHQELCTGPRCAPSPCTPSPIAGLSAQQLPVAISPGIQQGCWEIREHAIWKGEMLWLCYFLHRNRFYSSKVKPWFLGKTTTGQWCSVKVNGEWMPTQAEGTSLLKSDSQEMCKRAAEKLTSGSSLDGTFRKKRSQLDSWGFPSALENPWGCFPTGFIKLGLQALETNLYSQNKPYDSLKCFWGPCYVAGPLQPSEARWAWEKTRWDLFQTLGPR